MGHKSLVFLTLSMLALIIGGVVFYVTGFRVSPDGEAQMLVSADLKWITIGVYQRGDQIDTVGCEPTWLGSRCRSRFVTHLTSDPVQTLGWFSVGGSRHKATFLALISTDPRVAYIAGGTGVNRKIVSAPLNEPVSLQWEEKQVPFDELNLVALGKDGSVLYEYRLPHTAVVSPVSDLRWYPAR